MVSSNIFFHGYGWYQMFHDFFEYEFVIEQRKVL
jgi:hypothetical protein